MAPAFDGYQSERPGDDVALAVASLVRALEKAQRTVEPHLDPGTLARLRALMVTLYDQRFRELAIHESARLGVAAGMRAVAAEYARAPFRGDRTENTSPDLDHAWRHERAVEIEDFCQLIASQSAKDPYPRPGAVVVAERMSAFLVLAACARRARALLVAGPATQDLVGAAIAKAARLPMIVDVEGLFAWTRPGDRLLVDGTTGVVRVNPPATAVARYRHRAPADALEDWD